MLLALLISSNVFILPSAQLPRIPKTKPPLAQIPPEDSRQKTEQEKALLSKYLISKKYINSTLSSEILDFSTKKEIIQNLIADIQKSSAEISDKDLKEINDDSLIEYRNMQPQDIEKMIIEAKAALIVEKINDFYEWNKPIDNPIAKIIKSLKDFTTDGLDTEMKNEILEVLKDLPKNESDKIMPLVKDMKNTLKADFFKQNVIYFEKNKTDMGPKDQDAMSKFLEDLALDITPSDKDEIQSILKEYRDLAQTRAQKERAILAKAKKSLAEIEAMYEKIPAKTKDTLLDSATQKLKESQRKEAEAKVKAAQKIVDARKAADKARFNKEQQEKIVKKVVEKLLADANQRKQRAAEKQFDDFLKRTQELQRLEK